jgi:hypothetical protein
MHTKIALQVAIGAIMFFGFGILSVQGQALTNTFSFQSDFETLATPLCGIGGEEVVFSGTAHFKFHETLSAGGSVHQSTMMNYMKTKGVGIQSGDKYEINEANIATLQDNEENDIVYSVITGKLVHAGKGTDTGVTINLLTTFDSDGDAKTEVEKI